MRFCERHIRFQSRENINLVLHLNFSGEERDSKGLREANLYKQFPLSYQNKHILSIVSKIFKIMKYQNCCHFVSFRSTRLPCVPHTMKGKKEILKKYGNANMLKDSAHLSKQVFHSRQNLQNPKYQNRCHFVSFSSTRVRRVPHTMYAVLAARNCSISCKILNLAQMRHRITVKLCSIQYHKIYV